MKWEKEGFLISDDREDMDIQLIYDFLRNSYWAKDIPKEIVVRSLDYSLCFGLFHNNNQVGFGRAITDRATFAYLTDIFIVESYRERGLGKWLINCIMAHPELQELRQWMLITADAHGLYEQYGFDALRDSKKYMEISRSDIYQSDT